MSFNIFFSFPAKRKSCISRPQTGDGGLLEEVQRKAQIKGLYIKNIYIKFQIFNFYYQIYLFQGAILTTMLATRNFSSEYNLFLYLLSPS